MLDDTLTLVSWRTRPRSFVALMALYESNYIRLNWLAGDLRALQGKHRSSSPEDCDLVLSVTERAAYTTTLNLTYLLPGPQEPQEFPDMHVRIYHDARLVEAQEWAMVHTSSVLRALRSRAERELDQRWARNMMLNKWLEYCLERGHRFSPATRTPAGS